MTDNPVIITKHRAYHARAIKDLDFNTMKQGYNFSYPVLNTIDIGNLFITGASKDIQIERMGKTTWSFDKEKSELTIEKSKTKETHYIVDVKELYMAMSKYFKENASKLEKKNNLIAEKKSEANLGNQNAKKDKDVESNIKQEQKPEINDEYEDNPFTPYRPQANIVSPSRSQSRCDFLD